MRNVCFGLAIICFGLAYALHEPSPVRKPVAVPAPVTQPVQPIPSRPKPVEQPVEPAPEPVQPPEPKPEQTPPHRTFTPAQEEEILRQIEEGKRLQALPSSTKRIGSTLFRVVLNDKDQWYDTGIPMITETFYSIVGATSGQFAIKIGEMSDMVENRAYIELTERTPPGHAILADYDFQTTLKMKLTDQSPTRPVTFEVKFQEKGDYHCGIDIIKREHSYLHARSVQWFKSKINAFPF